MNLLFIQGGSRVRKSINGSFFVDGNFNNSIWKRYKSYCDNLCVILRKSPEEFEEDFLEKKFNRIDTSLMDLKLVSDIYSPKLNFVNLSKRSEIKKVIEESVREADFIIIRSIGNFYTNTALKYCKKYNKRYLIEVTGFAFDGLWYQGILGKIVALPRELYLKRSLKKAPYAVYVTEEALQKRYPTQGSSLGCSDVEIKDDDFVDKKVAKKIIIGTAAFLDVKWKGQENVIRAVSLLKKRGYDNVEYQLVGSGNGEKLKKLIQNLNLEESVKIVGALKHEEVFNWLKGIDIYVQPSYQEGLCRSIVEAMSVGCPVICSNVGGNYELINQDYIYEKHDYGSLADKIESLMKSETDYKSERKRNYEFSKKFSSGILNKKRNEFYEKVINGEEIN